MTRTRLLLIAVPIVLSLLSALVAGCDDKDKRAELIAKTGGSATDVGAASAHPFALAAAASSAAPAPKPPKVCPSGNEITIDDPDIEMEVRRKAKKPEGPLTAADLARVTSIRINARPQPLEEVDPCIFPKMVSLRFLYLPKGTYRDLSPISGLTKLEGLFFPDSEVEDLSPLSRLVMLDQLGLAHTPVRDIGPIANLVNLTELTLDDTHVTDLSPLAKCTKLEKLSIKNTPVTDVSPLKDLRKLKSLTVAGTAIRNLDVLDPLRARGLRIITN
jgi:internalin A